MDSKYQYSDLKNSKIKVSFEKVFENLHFKINIRNFVQFISKNPIYISELTTRVEKLTNQNNDKKL